MKLATIIKNLLTTIGENVKRDGLVETPVRVERMYEELLSGYKKDPKKIFKKFESESYKGLITVSNIDFYSLCEHHLLPFFGKVSIGYVPNGHILGLSKFARLVDIYSRRLQVQEHLTTQIADTLMKYLKAKGVIVHISAVHLCMSMRGVNKDGAITKTTIVRGSLKNDHYLQNQFYTQI